MEEFQQYSSRASRKLVLGLRQKGLLEYDGQKDFLSLHPLVRNRIYAALKPDTGNCAGYLRAFTQRMKDYWNFSREKKSHCRRYILAVLKGLPIEAAGLEELFVLADFLWQMGEWEVAEDYTRRLFGFVSGKKGQSLKDMARAANLAASVYYNSGRYGEAARWHRKTWEFYRECKEKEPFYEALYLSKFSRCLWWEGDRKGAEHCLKRAEGIYEKAIREGRDTKRCRSFLLNLYIEYARRCQKEGDYDRGLTWCRKAERLSGELEGGKTTEAFILHDKALLFRGKGNREKSREYLEKALLCAGRTLDGENPELKSIKKDWKTFLREEKDKEKHEV